MGPTVACSCYIRQACRSENGTKMMNHQGTTLFEGGNVVKFFDERLTIGICKDKSGTWLSTKTRNLQDMAHEDASSLLLDHLVGRENETDTLRLNGLSDNDFNDSIAISGAVTAITLSNDTLGFITRVSHVVRCVLCQFHIYELLTGNCFYLDVSLEQV